MSMESQDKASRPARAIEAIASLGTGPTFHLIYLVFLFIPWLFQKPSSIDVIVAVLAVAAFIPVHYHAYRTGPCSSVLPIALVALIGMATAFFVTNHGVFHIYCAAMAGFYRPVRASGVILALCTLGYLAAAYLAGRHWLEIGFILFMAMVIWLSTMSNAQTLLENQQLEREHELDTQAASLMERERIARDMHDLLGHTLTMVALKSDLANRLIDTQPEQAKQEIQQIQAGARRALHDVRAALTGLTVVSIKNELANATQALASAEVELTVTGDVPALNSEQEKVYGLMIREAVTNIIKHTSSTEVTIAFSSDVSTRMLSISDNGDGKVKREGRGLSGLRLRIESLGGAVSIDHVNGVRLDATLPMKVGGV